MFGSQSKLSAKYSMTISAIEWAVGRTLLLGKTIGWDRASEDKVS